MLPIIIYFENKTGAQSRKYWPCDWRFYDYLQIILFFGFFYVNAMYIYWNIKFSGETTLGYSLVLLVYNLLYIGRITIVAIKWAYLPPQIFPLMRKKQLTQAQFNMIHLLTGWVAVNNKTGLAREIGQSCARLELDISSLKFSFRDEYTQRLKSTNLSLRRRCSTYTTYGNLLIPYVVFCASKHIGAKSKFYIVMSRFASPIICAGPFVARLLTWWNPEEGMVEDDHENGWDWTQTALAIPWNLLAYVTTVNNLSTLILFCSVIALDFQRRYGLVRFSTRLMQPNKDAFRGFVNYDDYKSHLFPKCALDKERKKILDSAIIQTLDLSDAETVYNWSLLRAFFLDFGLRFLRREEAILGFFCLAIFFIIAFYLTMLYSNVLKPTFLEAAFVVLSSVAVLFPAGNALKYATKINQKVQDQKAILADKRLRLENEKSSVDAQMVREQKHVDDMIHRGSEVEVNDDYVSQQIESTVESIGRASCMMETIMNMLEVDRFRIRLLGYPIDTTVTGIIAGIVGTIGFLVTRLLIGDDAEGIPDTR